MTTWLAACVLGIGLRHTPSISIERDNFGVAQVRAETLADAYYAMGQAVAQDRLWQMELSRRAARGQLSEIYGPGSVPADTEVLQRAYTQEEYDQMFAQLPNDVQTTFLAYADGVNSVIQERTEKNTLPLAYEQGGISPRPWTVTDSCAIAVTMARLFGGGGAGELRNYALLQYLTLRPVANQSLDVLDDLAWFNDEDSPTTVSRTDDPIANRPVFAQPTRRETELHRDALPKTSVFELAGAATMASLENSALFAQKHGLLYKSGSYAAVVSPRRSSTGNPLLLTAPQMGHQYPSVIHEISINTPELKVSGMSPPGIPGIMIGVTPDMAWGLTTAVADIEDVFVSTLKEGDTYLHQGQERELERITFNLKVRDEEDREVVQYRTVHGPVLLLSRSSNAVYSLKSSFWKRELASYAAVLELPTAKSTADIRRFTRRVPVAFNFFFALRSGEIGFRYMGYMPVRANGVDPRLPLPDTAENQWKGIIPAEQMPRVDDPSSGLIVNWNNKPVWWWPNLDTPAWGALFRSSVLADALKQDKISIANLEHAAWTIARKEAASNAAFMPLFRAVLEGEYGRTSAPEPARQLMSYDGWQTEGSIPATIYNETLRQLRRVMFLPKLGNLTNESLFVQAVQPSLVLRAIQKQTKYDWLEDSTMDDVILKAYEQAVARLEQSLGEDIDDWGYSPGTIPDPFGPSVPYNNRGTYIQITEMTENGPRARSVASPGVAESGPHQADQVPLARGWTYKPVWNWTSTAGSR